MSGGSFDYLCWAAEELSGRKGDIQAMAAALEAMDEPSARIAARSTRTVLHLVMAAEDCARKLEEVWHAVEWWKSCDWSEDQAREVIRKYAPWPPEPCKCPCHQDEQVSECAVCGHEDISA